MIDFDLFPGQIALMLGIDRNDILSWITNGQLSSKKYGKTWFVPMSDLADFLGQHRELVGRLYCDDGLPVLTEWKQEIIEEMDNRWPLEPPKWQSFSVSNQNQS